MPWAVRTAAQRGVDHRNPVASGFGLIHSGLDQRDDLSYLFDARA